MASTETFANPTVILHTKGFCILCLKQSEKPVISTNTTNSENDHENNLPECKVNVEEVEAAARLRQQFSKVISRYLGTTFTFLNTSQSDDFDLGDNDGDEGGFMNRKFAAVPQVDVGLICNDCSFLVEKICHLFHEMTKLEMELDWKARQLKSVMAFAKRAPTRVKVFRERFTDSGTQEDMEELERIEMFRKEMLDKCSAKFRKLQPRIALKRRGDPSSKSSRRRKKAKRLLYNVTLHDAEVQTEDTVNSPLNSKNHSSGTSNKNNLSDAKGSKAHKKSLGNDAHASVDNDIDSNHARSPSPAPPSPEHSIGPAPEENDGSECFLRIRTIESLASPTKSVSSVLESPVRRKSPRQLRSHAIPTDDDDIVEVVQLQNGNENPTRRQTRSLLKSVPDIVASSNKSIQITEVRKATLTEWLQSTFNCDKCNKMFISEATLSVHKTTCGVEETRRMEETTQDNDEPSEQDDDDAGECPMDISQADDSSEDEQEDPLGEEEREDNSVEAEAVVEKASEAETTNTPRTTTTTTIRILKKNPAPEPSTKPSETRYCKYCKNRYSRNHFSRHRETLKHKENKRAHKRAKKEGKLVTVNKAGTKDSAGDIAVIQANDTVSNNSAAAHAASSTAIVTVSRDENNVNVVKIIYVANNNENEEGNQNTASVGNQEKGNGEGQSGKENPSEPIVINNCNENEVIDISDD